jgi:hypothetical protein
VAGAGELSDIAFMHGLAGSASQPAALDLPTPLLGAVEPVADRPARWEPAVGRMTGERPPPRLPLEFSAGPASERPTRDLRRRWPTAADRVGAIAPPASVSRMSRPARTTAMRRSPAQSLRRS